MVRDDALMSKITMVKELFPAILDQQASFFARYGVWIALIVGLVVVLAILVRRQRRLVAQQCVLEADFQKRAQELQEQCAVAEHQAMERTQLFQKQYEQFRAVALIAREAAALRELDALMDTIARLTAQQFGLYHVGVFLIDDAGEFAVMRAASSEGGQQLLAQEYKVRIAEQELVGSVAARGEPCIVLNAGQEAPGLSSIPELPAARSEMGLPLKVRDQVIGVLDLQSENPRAFSQEDVGLARMLADLLAVTVQNARLFEEHQRTVTRLETAYREQVEEVWQAQAAARAYAYDGLEIKATTVNPTLSPELLGVAERQLVMPISLRGQVVGSLMLERDIEQEPWSVDELMLAEEIGVQAGLALENAQLLADSRQRVVRQQQLGEISAQFSRSMDVEAMLRTAVRELGRLPGVAEVSVHLDLPQAPRISEPATDHREDR